MMRSAVGVNLRSVSMPKKFASELAARRPVVSAGQDPLLRYHQADLLRNATRLVLLLS